MEWQLNKPRGLFSDFQQTSGYLLFDCHVHRSLVCLIGSSKISDQLLSPLGCQAPIKKPVHANMSGWKASCRKTGSKEICKNIRFDSWVVKSVLLNWLTNLNLCYLRELGSIVKIAFPIDWKAKKYVLWAIEMSSTRNLEIRYGTEATLSAQCWPMQNKIIFNHYLFLTTRL